MAVTQVQKIFALSTVLALGFVLMVLSGVSVNGWLPSSVALMFILAPLPNSLCGNARRDDLMSDAPDLLADFGRFLTGFLLVSGLVLPVLYAHNSLIPVSSMIMSLLGGFIIYGSIIAFGLLFDEPEEY